MFQSFAYKLGVSCFPFEAVLAELPPNTPKDLKDLCLPSKRCTILMFALKIVDKSWKIIEKSSKISVPAARGDGRTAVKSCSQAYQQKSLLLALTQLRIARTKRKRKSFPVRGRLTTATPPNLRYCTIFHAWAPLDGFRKQCFPHLLVKLVQGEGL